MANFIKRIGIDGTSADFIFKSVFAGSNAKYFVTVELDGKTISFDLKRTAQGWVVVPPAPDWIKQIEQKLSIAVNSQL